MNMSSESETSTVIKRILPYLERRGYKVDDMDFEVELKNPDNYHSNFSDILIMNGNSRLFLIEAKKSSKRLTDKDRDQAIKYAKELKVPFVVVTNGIDIRTYQTSSKKPIHWGNLSPKGFRRVENIIPQKSDLVSALTKVRQAAKGDYLEVPVGSDLGTPFRPGASLSKINAVLKHCHNVVRKIEKNEDTAFADFSKLLFLKLLEEKSDRGQDSLTVKTGLTTKSLYTFRFHELASVPKRSEDQVMDSIKSMIEKVRRDSRYKDVITSDLELKNPTTVHTIVRQLASISFSDSELDSKGAAFEYFVRATLKGKKLGQYFTPRPLVKLMLSLYGIDKLINSVSHSEKFKVYDPACGTGGFLVYSMQEGVDFVDKMKMSPVAANQIKDRLRKKTFYGSDANAGVASTAKMNMIVAGDGHSNIIHEDSLKITAQNWSISARDCDLIMSNPPFGTSEKLTLDKNDLQQFDRRDVKGQMFFIQKMIASSRGGAEILTVIDEGVLNNNSESAKYIRKLILSSCKILSIISLPEETFKPNKINVKSSVLHLKVRDDKIDPTEEDYLISMIDLRSLGYYGSGEEIRGFSQDKMIESVIEFINSNLEEKENEYLYAYKLKTSDIVKDSLIRLDVKYYNPKLLEKLKDIGVRAKNISDLNSIPTSRGKSPPKSQYVDKSEGYAAVIKSGSSIDRYGNVSLEGDYIDEATYENFGGIKIKIGDVLLSSTGEGTLGKCAVYDSDTPAIADTHVTVIRPSKIVDSQYLCDYLRVGLGHLQVQRLFTGSTGQIELPPELVDRINVDLKNNIKEQRKYSAQLREIERKYQDAIKEAEADFKKSIIDLDQ